MTKEPRKEKSERAKMEGAKGAQQGVPFAFKATLGWPNPLSTPGVLAGRLIQPSIVPSSTQQHEKSQILWLQSLHRPWLKANLQL